MNSAPPPPKVYGLIGYPVKHSLSPIMHNAAFKHLGINADYRLFPVKPEELEAFLLKNIIVKDIDGNEVYSEDILGFNITIPHKVTAKEILEKEVPPTTEPILSFERYVKLSGAINTVLRKGGRLYYRNTDAFGFLKSLEEDLKYDTKDKDVLIIGCGGAGRAVFASLGWTGKQVKKIYIYEINDRVISSVLPHFSQIPYLEGRWKFISYDQIPMIIKNCQLLVNASPVGMKEGDNSVIDKSLLHKELYVYDVVYNRQTQLIKDARSLGLPVADGLGMLLWQGVVAFEFWTGRTAPVEIMRQALEEAINKS